MGEASSPAETGRTRRGSQSEEVRGWKNRQQRVRRLEGEVVWRAQRQKEVQNGKPREGDRQEAREASRGWARRGTETEQVL